jgi:hypothetical protein
VTPKGYKPSNSRGITLQRVEEVMREMRVGDPNCAGAVFALLDDRLRIDGMKRLAP